MKILQFHQCIVKIVQCTSRASSSRELSVDLYDGRLKDDENISIGLLIGGNCPTALEPVKVISSGTGCPYAYQSRPG